jgi:hypothetical protein
MATLPARIQEGSGDAGEINIKQVADMNNEFSLDTRPLVGKLKDIRPLKVRLVNKTAWEQV